MEFPPELEPLPDEIEISAVRAQGAGGQNVNKVSNAVHLRFDIPASRLPAAIKQRLLALADRRIGADGVVVIKAQTRRSLPLNQADAMQRLRELIARAAHVPEPRTPTQVPRAAKRRRLADKRLRGALKARRSGGAGEG